MANNWIQKAIKSPGALHRQLGVKQGEKIPASKLAAARSGKYGALAQRRANLARTLGRLRHKSVKNDPLATMKKGMKKSKKGAKMKKYKHAMIAEGIAKTNPKSGKLMEKVNKKHASEKVKLASLGYAPKKAKKTTKR